MTYAPIVKLKKFMGKEDDTQAIQADYFTVPQILNQFIRGLCSSILQCVYPMHPANFQAAVTNTRDFEATELEANHVQELISMLLFSKAAFKKKPIITIYTNAKVNGYSIKLILNNGSAGSIITQQLMNQLGCRVDHTASTKIITTNRITKTPIEEQEQWLEEINTQLYNQCLISCDFQYCNECDLIYNSPPHIIYTIPEKEEPISSCALELESTFNLNLNSNNNNNKNNDSSSIQNGNKNYDDSNFDSNPEQYIVLLNLSKKQELKWFSDNDEGIMPECAHDTNAKFDLRYPGKNAIKLELCLCICIDLKIALEILATTMIQLASRSSLVKKEINIREGIIDAEYVRNIITMLQNNSKKAYIIEPNKKITQAIFLLLVKIAQLVSVENREKLGITARKIQGFRSMGRINIPVNMTEKKIIDKEEIIFICQLISILPYDQYMITIERKIKDQIQIFKTETTLCESEKIGLVNLHIPAKNHRYIKIFIYNNTRDTIKILKRIIIEYLTTEVENQLLNTIPDFSQLCGYVDITSQTIYK
ncbi:hypothetical protein G9A89_004203 [Geosiphon pyriformis]|nr:hypothetical protein G9A89_004203 [Geosiphon pyriformis]